MHKSLYRVLFGLLAGTTALGILSRILFLGYPNEKVFDEVYFPVFAAKFLHGELAFDVHPPLGKLLIALGIWAFGDTPFGWRIIPAIFGVLFIGLMVFLWRSYMKKYTDIFSSLLVAAFVSLETMYVGYSRLGLMDGILLFFIMLTFLMGVRAKKRSQYYVAALIFGLSISIKWYAVAVIVPITFLAWRRKELGMWLGALPASLLVYLAICLWAQVIGGVAHPWAGVSEWHAQTWHYQTTLTDTHPWSSKWWSWPLMERPVLTYYKAVEGGISMMSIFGHPLLWWGGTGAVIGSWLYLLGQRILKKKAILDHPLLPLLLGQAAFFLPWVPVNRVLFIYHYLPAQTFAFLVLMYWYVRGFKIAPGAMAVITLLIIFVGIYYLPFATGFAMSDMWLHQHLWFVRWL